RLAAATSPTAAHCAIRVLSTRETPKQHQRPRGDGMMTGRTVASHERRLRLLLGGSLASAAWIMGLPPAYAQETGPASAQASEVSADSGNTILVTARRREESLQETPIAISAFSAETLQDRQIQQTQDLERITPSLQFKPAGQLSGNSSASVAFIRGVGQLDPTAAVDPAVGVYV